MRGAAAAARDMRRWPLHAVFAAQVIAMTDTLSASHRGLIRLVCALRSCGAPLSSGEMFFGGLPSARVGWLLGHGDDDEDDDEEERDEEEEEDDEDDDEEEPWQVCPLTSLRDWIRTRGRRLCAPSRPAALRSRISPLCA